MDLAKRPPRHFAYLDHEVAGSYLSHFIDGLPEGGSHTDRQGDDAGLGVNVGVPGLGGIKGRLGENGSFEDIENYRHTPASVFDRLYRLLDEHNMLTKPQYLDEEGWANLQRGDFVEITGALNIPDIVKMMGIARSFGDLFPFLEQLGSAGHMEITNEDQEMMGLLRMFGELGNPDKSPNAGMVVVEIPASPGYRFVATLKRRFLEGSLEELEGEITILGKLQRKIDEGDPPIGIEQLLPGLEGLRGIRGLNTDSQQTSDDDFAIGHPACTLIPLGIYL